MKPTFESTVDILVKAYLNDTLQHGNCEACAVGNIVHAAGWHRYYPSPMELDSCGIWRNVFYTDPEIGHQILGNIDRGGKYYIAGVKAIEATGYTFEQLARVENSFESADKGESDDEWMFNGLMAVVDVLADIHGIDLKVKEEAKLLFVKP